MSGVKVHVTAVGPVARDVADRLRGAGMVLVDAPGPDVVVVLAAKTVDQALDACPPAFRPGQDRLLVLADSFDPAGVLRAVRMGASAVLCPVASPLSRLVAGVHSALHGDGVVPYQALVRLLGSSGGAMVEVEALTAKQTAVLQLMADGLGNSAIARALACSEHTVKNVIYELTARLRVRNRAHAVAHAVRLGLI
ncbi:response regulator transcription factor [Actinosynnema sp. NPDC053489]|uniref:response regulator transcription factor n=1 Tax=Actinosynnema sp. NPDC053489 TaxID=3363916 RepID=UPI0037C5881A